MERYEIQERYMRWMQNKVTDEKHPAGNYIRLFKFLNETTFNYTIPRDGNRADDGIELRYIFGREEGIQDPIIADALDCYDCSVLEMMIALAMRCQNWIVGATVENDETSKWFWSMIRNLGLEDQTDTNFSSIKVDRVITRFLDRDYEPDGTGGLFKVKNYTRDMRDVEIWYQLCWYLDEVLDAS